MELAHDLQDTSVGRSILTWRKKIFRKGINAVTEHPYRAIGGIGIASAALGMIIYHMRSRRHVDTPSQNHEEQGPQLQNTVPPSPPLNQVQQRSTHTTQEPTKPTLQESEPTLPKPTPTPQKSRLHQISQQNTLQQNENVPQIFQM